MKLIVGLGNPGKEYEKTRHNIGFMLVEQFLKDYHSAPDTVWTEETKFKSTIAEIEWQTDHKEREKVILAKPKTYMNNSGMAVGAIASFYKLSPEDIWVLHDDVDLRLGALRIRNGGGSAGHRGIESLLSVFPNGNFWRFRLGIGRPERPVDLVADRKGVDDYVLGNFSHEDHSKVKELLTHASKALQMALEDGLEASMNKFNTK